MKFFIVDDDPNIVMILRDIILKNNLGSIIGSSLDGCEALEEIQLYPPDILLVDYLMPGLDGATLIRSIRESSTDVTCIMISQVSNAEMVADTYKAGVEFFIHKPINLIEVINVIKSVSEKIQMKKQISKIQEIFASSLTPPSSPCYIEGIQVILTNLGILGERGGKDLLDICKEAYKKDCRYPWEMVPDIMNLKDKITKQRIRRAINVGLVNIANMGIEDNLNEFYLKYSNTLFDFQEVRSEMERLRGTSLSKGKVNLNKFTESLLIQNKNI